MNQFTSDRLSLVKTAVITTVLGLGAGTPFAQERPPDPDPGTAPQAKRITRSFRRSFSNVSG